MARTCVVGGESVRRKSKKEGKEMEVVDVDVEDK